MAELLLLVGLREILKRQYLLSCTGDTDIKSDVYTSPTHDFNNKNALKSFCRVTYFIYRFNTGIDCSRKAYGEICTINIIIYGPWNTYNSSWPMFI
jgi:hypothetical protein